MGLREMRKLRSMSTGKKEVEVTPIPGLLRRLRERAGMSRQQMADALGMASGNSYAHYETRYKKDWLPPDLAHGIVQELQKRGVSNDDCAPLLKGAAAHDERSMMAHLEAIQALVKGLDARIEDMKRKVADQENVG